jgi:pilus assembly protein Flp/PilA
VEHRDIGPKKENHMISKLQQILTGGKSDDGASAVEYGLLVAAIAAVIVAVVFVVGGYVQGAFDDTCAGIEAGNTTNANGDSCP